MILKNEEVGKGNEYLCGRDGKRRRKVALWAEAEWGW